MVKKLMKSSLAVLALTASVMTSNAQTPKKTPEQRAQRQTEWMQQNLGINSDQNKKIHDILLRHAQQEDAAKNAGGDLRGKMRDLKTKREDDLQNVLTKDQYKKYRQHMQEREVQETKK